MSTREWSGWGPHLLTAAVTLTVGVVSNFVQVIYKGEPSQSAVEITLHPAPVDRHSAEPLPPSLADDTHASPTVSGAVTARTQPVATQMKIPVSNPHKARNPPIWEKIGYIQLTEAQRRILLRK